MSKKSSGNMSKARKKAIRHKKEMALKRRNPRKYRKYIKRKRKRQILRFVVLFLFFAIIAGVFTGTALGIRKIWIYCSEISSERNLERQQKKKESQAAKEQASEEAAKNRAERRAAEEQAIAEWQAESEARKAAKEHGQDITIGATGCMLMHGPITKSARYSDGNGGFDFSDIFRYIKPYYSKPDFMTCEFEGSLTGEDYEGFPTFHVPDAIVQNYTDSGIDLTLMASNHVFDGVEDGFYRTMEVMDKMNLKYTGIRSTPDKKRYYIADIQGIKVGFVNYVYEQESEYGTHGLNAIPISDSDWELINTFNYDELDAFYAEMQTNLENMRQDGAQFLIANMHWGTEYQLKESQVQRDMAQKLCDLGVDAIIGGHPHCEQPIDVLQSSDGTRNMFCIYSVGNALSNQRRALLMEEMPEGHTEDGVIVMLTLNLNKEGIVRLTDVDVIPTWVYMDEDYENNAYYIVAVDDPDKLENETGIPGIRSYAQESYNRTMEVMGEGLKKAKEIFGDSNAASDKNTVEMDTVNQDDVNADSINSEETNNAEES